MTPPRERTLTLIAAFKLAKGVLLLVLALGLLRLVHQDLAQLLTGWFNELRIDPGNRYAASILSKVGLLNENNVRLLSWLTLAYAALFLPEGVGLLLRKRWAEWITVISTGSFLPFEVYELFHKLSSLKVVLLLANAAIFVFLIHRLRHRPKASLP